MRISDWSSDVCSSDLELDSGNLAGELAIGTCSGHLVARHRQSDNAVERRSVEVLVHEHTTAPIGDAEITDHATDLDAITRLALWTIVQLFEPGTERRVVPLIFRGDHQGAATAEIEELVHTFHVVLPEVRTTQN